LGVDGPFRVTIYTPASAADATRFAGELAAWKAGQKQLSE
jgi:hypothetical protein